MSTHDSAPGGTTRPWLDALVVLGLSIICVPLVLRPFTDSAVSHWLTAAIAVILFLSQVAKLGNSLRRRFSATTTPTGNDDPGPFPEP